MIRLPVALQGRQILTAAVLGLVLAAVYDLLRGIRRLRPGCTGLMDFVFGLLLLTGLLWFMLYPGLGMLRGYDLLAVGVGAGLWFWSISPVFLPLWIVVLRKIAAFFRLLLWPLTKSFKIFRQITKKYFSFCAKWVKMICNIGRVSAKMRKDKGGNGHALQTVISVDQDFDPGAGGVCYRYPGFPAESGDDSRGGSRTAAS